MTLNSLDPNELKSADMIAPGVARRKRTQAPVSTKLTYLDFDGNSEIIKSLTGKVKSEYQEIFKNATGSSALKVSLVLEPQVFAYTDRYQAPRYRKLRLGSRTVAYADIVQCFPSAEQKYARLANLSGDVIFP